MTGWNITICVCNIDDTNWLFYLFHYNFYIISFFKRRRCNVWISDVAYWSYYVPRQIYWTKLFVFLLLSPLRFRDFRVIYPSRFRAKPVYCPVMHIHTRSWKSFHTCCKTALLIVCVCVREEERERAHGKRCSAMISWGRKIDSELTNVKSARRTVIMANQFRTAPKLFHH